MTPTQQAIRADIEAYEALEEKLRKQLAVFNKVDDRIGLANLVVAYHRTLTIIAQLNDKLGD